MIINTVSENQFVESFDVANRSNNFSVEARRALFQFLEELSDDMGEHIELDPIGLCCDWTEGTGDELVQNANGIEDLEDIDDIIEAISDDHVLIVVRQYGEDDTYLIAH